MTTYTLNAIRVTSSGGTATVIAPTSLTLQTTGSFFFNYAMDAASPTDFSSITITPPFGALRSAVIDGVRFDMNDAASVAEYTWTLSGETKKTMMMKIDLGVSGEAIYIAMGGADLPTFADTAAYNAFMATVTATSSVITDPGNPFRPGANISMALFSDAGVATNQNDTFIHNSLFDDWTETALKTGAGNDSVDGSSNGDIIEGETGNDTIDGLGGNDSILGGDGDDLILGYFGADSLVGGNGNDRINGEADADTIRGGAGNDSLNGGSGDDRVEGDAGADTVIGGAGADKLEGGLDADTLDGGTEADTLLGGSQNDYLLGGDGADSLNGGTNADTLDGGEGNDRLVGAGGPDTFIFQQSDDIDTVAGFGNDLDTLVFDNIIGFETVEDVMAVATQQGQHVVIDLGNEDVITLLKFTLANLADDILVL